MRRGRLAVAAVLAVAIVATLLVNPLGLAAVERSSPVGEAEAQVDAGCTVLAFIGPGTSPTACVGQEADQDDMADWLGIYTEMLTAKSQAESFLATYENAITDSGDTAFLLGEQKMVQAYLNDSSQAAAKTAAREEIRSYYTVRQKNLISAWNTQVASLENAYERNKSVDSEPGTISNWVSGEAGASAESVSFTKRNVSLADGSEMEIRRLQIETQYNPCGSCSYEYGTVTLDMVDPTGQGNGEYETTLGQVNFDAPPDTEYNNYIFYKPELDWHDLWNKTDQKRSEVSSEVDTLVEGTYTEFQAGNVNATELLSRLNLMENYQVDVGDNATFNDVVAALSAQGFSTPESSTGWMQIRYDPVFSSGNTTVTNDGMLLSGTAPPNETWEVGTEYDANNLEGAQLVATLDGEQHTINSTFEILGAYNESGAEIEDPTITSPERDYTVATVEELNDQIALLGDEIARLNNMTSGGDGGGGGWGWPDVPNPFGFLAGIGRWLVIGVAAFLLLFALSLLK